MSELLSARGNRKAIHWQLLTTVSMLALLPYAWTIDGAKAGDDADRPAVWIELGGQLERQTGQGDSYEPPFLVNYPTSSAYIPISPLQTEKPPILSNGAEATLSFQPEGWDWVFSASVRYGRANGNKSVHQVGAPVQVHYGFPRFGSSGIYFLTGLETPSIRNFSNADVTHHDSHAIIDFQVGKDVGLGSFGRGGEFVVSAGVRFAQFTAKSSAVLHAKPDTAHYNGANPYNVQRYPQLYFPYSRYHLFGATAQSARSFHGLGPAISWNSSIALLGNAQAGEFSFDWGVNGAVLFGRRKVVGQHHESGHFHRQYYNTDSDIYSTTIPIDRSRTVTVPNLGGFAGVSFKFPNAKVSLGYRGDFFFGAMDTGIDTEKTKTVGFYGPFASISFGIGG